MYCAVLPARWSVESGQYRLAGGGWMRIAYRARAVPASSSPRAPSAIGRWVRAGRSGRRFRRVRRHAGTLIAGDDGRYAVVVDRGARRSLVAIGEGLDVDTFKGFAADLLRVEG